MKCARPACQREAAPRDSLCPQCRLHDQGACKCTPEDREPWGKRREIARRRDAAGAGEVAEGEMITVGSLFSGIGGLELGIERAVAARVVWQAEQDEFCRAALAHHWPEAKRYADVVDVGRDTAARVDIICGGFPCQDISVAGEGAGIDGARSGLWSEYARIVGELRPRVVVVENVAALLGRGLGRVLGDLSTLGYDAWWDCIPAEAVGAPHRRDRLYVVAWRVPDADGSGLRNITERGNGAASKRAGGHAFAEHLGEDVADTAGSRCEGTERGNAFAGPGASGGEVVANGDGERRRSREHVSTRQPHASERRTFDVADADGARQPQPERCESGIGRRFEHGGNPRGADRPGDWPPGPDDMHAWGSVPADAQPAFCRLAHGVRHLVVGRRARLKAFGNAVVPQCPEALAEVIAMALSQTSARGAA